MANTMLKSETQHPDFVEYPNVLSGGLPDRLVWDSRGRAILFVCPPPPVGEDGVAQKDLLEEVDPELYAYIRGLPSNFVPSIELVYGPEARNHPELIEKFERYVNKDSDYLHHIVPVATAVSGVCIVL
jgi:hypothetical protein